MSRIVGTCSHCNSQFVVELPSTGGQTSLRCARCRAYITIALFPSQNERIIPVTAELAEVEQNEAETKLFNEATSLQTRWPA